jgi:hypothetical protein
MLIKMPAVPSNGIPVVPAATPLNACIVVIMPITHTTQCLIGRTLFPIPVEKNDTVSAAEFPPVH